MKAYHIIKNGIPQEVTADELNDLMEAKQEIQLDYKEKHKD